jgi:hypothetical protein
MLTREAVRLESLTYEALIIGVGEAAEKRAILAAISKRPPQTRPALLV